MAEEHQTVAQDLDESVLGDVHHPLMDGASIDIGEMEGHEKQEALLEVPKSRANMAGDSRGIGVSKGSFNSTMGLD